MFVQNTAISTSRVKLGIPQSISLLNLLRQEMPPLKSSQSSQHHLLHQVHQDLQGPLDRRVHHQAHRDRHQIHPDHRHKMESLLKRSLDYMNRWVMLKRFDFFAERCSLKKQDFFQFNWLKMILTHYWSIGLVEN